AGLSRSDRRGAPPAPDGWFEELDKRRIVNGSSSYVVQVDGVHTDSRGAWVQVAFVDHPESSVVLRISRYATVANAVAALRAWLEKDAHQRRHVIEVMQLSGLRLVRRH